MPRNSLLLERLKSLKPDGKNSRQQITLNAHGHAIDIHCAFLRQNVSEVVRLGLTGMFTLELV